MTKDTNRIINNDIPTSSEFRIGNIVASPPDGISIINGISKDIIEIQSLYEDVELHLIEMKNVSGYALIKGYGDYVPEMIFKENGFIKASAISVQKTFSESSIMSIDIDYLRNGWNVLFGGACYYVNYVHEFQNVYHLITKEELKIKQFKRVLS